MAISTRLSQLLLSALGLPDMRDELSSLLNTTGYLADGTVLIGNSSGAAAAVTPSGDVTITNAGVTTIGANKVTKSMLALDTLQYRDTTLTTAQILALNTTPISLVPAQGTGLVVFVDSIVASLVYNSTTYSCNASGASLKYKSDAGGQSVGIALTQGFIQSSTGSNFAYVRGGTTLMTDVTANLANQPVVIQAATSDPTTGNSAIKIRVYYKVIALPLT